MNSHRVSRVNKLLQLCSNKQTSTLGFNKVASLAPSTTIYDKPILSQDALRAQTGSISCLLINQQLRTITFCLIILWFDSVFYFTKILSYLIKGFFHHFVIDVHFFHQFFHIQL